jgi:hypothetical protein
MTLDPVHDKTPLSVTGVYGLNACLCATVRGMEVRAVAGSVAMVQEELPVVALVRIRSLSRVRR